MGKASFIIDRIRKAPNCSNNHRKAVIFKVVIWILTFVSYCCFHLTRKPISVVKGVLYENCTVEQNVTNNSTCHSWAPFDHKNADELLGSLDYAFLFSYAISMFFSGHIAERVNIRYFLTIGMIGSGFFCMLFGMAYFWKIHSFMYFLAIQIFAGIFQSVGWPCVVTCMGNWFGKQHRGLLMGIWNAHTSVGNILGTTIPAVFVDSCWGLSFVIPAAMVFFMAIVVFLFLVPDPTDVDLESPNHPVKEETAEQDSIVDSRISTSANSDDDWHVQNHDTTNDPGEDVTASLLPNGQTEDKAISFFRALTIPGVAEFSLSLFFAKLVSYTFLFWLPYYIHDINAHYSPRKSSNLSTMFDVGGIFGTIAAGLISDFYGIPGITCVVMLAAAAPMLYVYEAFGAYTFSDSAALLIALGFLVNGPYGLITTAVAANLGTHPCLKGSSRALATVTAIIDGTGSMGAALGPLLTSLLHSATSGWSTVFYMLIAAEVLAVLALTRTFYRECHRCSCCIQQSQ